MGLCMFVVKLARRSALALSLCASWGALLLSAGPASADSDNRTQLERGEYLVRAANCVSCHTQPGGDVFAGGVPFPSEFGTLYSTNITPDATTGIGNWSFEQFAAAMRRGVRPDGEHLYPAFPYPSFTRIDDDDLRALYAYFMSLRPVSAAARPNELKFPYNQRRLLGLWKSMYFEEGRFVPDAKQSAQWNRGAYLVEALAHCSACHSPRNLLGAEQADALYTGGTLQELDEARSFAARRISHPRRMVLVHGPRRTSPTI
jgi:mono/diheme cytochrome c family protein